MANRDRFGHVIPEMEKEIMAHFDTQIRGDFGNTPAILEAAHEDLAADNAEAAQVEYGRLRAIYNAPLSVISANHHACDCREAALKNQIERLIEKGDLMASRLKWLSYSADLHNHVVPWNGEVIRARELIK